MLGRMINTAVFHRSHHLNERQLEPFDSRCPFCRSADREPVYLLQETPEILLMKCNNCQAVSASRMPTSEALKEYYNDYYDTSGSQHSEALVTFDDPLRLANNLANMYRRYRMHEKISILDFGGGDGTIAHLLATQLVENGAAHVDITVVDYNTEMVRPQDSRIERKRKASLADIRMRYGFVIASAIIEHYPYPRPLLRDLLHCIAQGGLFYARTPSMLSIMKILQRLGVNVDFTYPGHLHDLGQAFWEGYFTRRQSEGFQILQSRPSIVETTFSKHFMRTVLAYSFKAPWYVFGKSYPCVGGWEIFIRRGSYQERKDH